MGKLGSALLNLLTGGLADKLLGYLERREQAKIAAMSATEKQAYDERQQDRANAHAVRMATAAFWEMRLLTFIIAACFTLHLVLVTLDTCFALGWKIAKFPAPFDQWEGAILLSFFGLTAASTGIRAAAAAVVIRRR